MAIGRIFLFQFKLPTAAAMTLIACTALVAAPGCEETKAQPEATAAREIRMPAAQAVQVGKGEELQKAELETKTKAREKAVELAQNTARPAEKSGRAAGRNGGSVGFDQQHALDQIAAEIRDCLSLRKTLVVWLVEQTSDSAPLTGGISNQIEKLMDGGKLPAGAGSPDGNALQAAVVGYGADVNLITPEPVSPGGQLHTALQKLGDKNGDKAMLFTALNQAAAKFLPFRKQGYEVLFVVVGVSPGDDLAAADQAIIALKRAAVPVLGIGPAMPFGRFGGAGGRGPRRPPAALLPAGDKRLFETLGPERIQLALSGNQSTADLTDSGYGPFGLERVCRQTGGKLFRIRDGRSVGWDVDPNTGDINAELLAKYAPDYVDEEQYQKLLAENKCRMALHNAALLPEMVGLELPQTNFPKQQDEAKMAKAVGIAQRASAERDQPIQKLYDTLVAGQADRPNLTGARWQAGYDLAMGETLAAKARIDGYNAMLAILKQGKAFANADSKRWVLEPADEIAAGSVLEKMAKNSRTYLQRVAQEHKGTPWAAIAERELKYPAGWKFVEQ